MTDTVSGRAGRAELEVLARVHAEAEGRGDLAAVLATLEADPVYELQPMGVELVGMELVKRYYDHFFSGFQSVAAGAVLRGEWPSDDGLGLEYTLWTRDPTTGATERHEVLGILTYGAHRLSGERIYASPRLFELMVGPVLGEGRPIDPSAPPA